MRTRNTTSRVKQAVLNELLFLSPPRSSLGISASHLVDRNAFDGGWTHITYQCTSFFSRLRVHVLSEKTTCLYKGAGHVRERTHTSALFLAFATSLMLATNARIELHTNV